MTCRQECYLEKWEKGRQICLTNRKVMEIISRIRALYIIYSVVHVFKRITEIPQIISRMTTIIAIYRYQMLLRTVFCSSIVGKLTTNIGYLFVYRIYIISLLGKGEKLIAFDKSRFIVVINCDPLITTLSVQLTRLKCVRNYNI